MIRGIPHTHYTSFSRILTEPLQIANGVILFAENHVIVVADLQTQEASS
jgi:hypothetical protein